MKTWRIIIGAIILIVMVALAVIQFTTHMQMGMNAMQLAAGLLWACVLIGIGTFLCYMVCKGGRQ